MQRDPRSYLWDMQEAAVAIANFIGKSDSRTYAETPLIHSAVERKFEIIGEALSQLARTFPEVAERVPDFRRIVEGTRKVAAPKGIKARRRRRSSPGAAC